MALAHRQAAIEADQPHSDHLSDKDYKRLSALVGRHAGIKLPPAKRVMLEGRLRRRVRTLGCENLAGYCRFLFEMDGLESELTHLIDAVTTNKTDFFREPQHFECLASMIVPTLLAARTPAPRPLLKIWSAACSTGAEAYTTAMVLSDLVARDQNFRFSILGTDISSDVLEHAAAAVFPEEMADPIPYDMQRRYLMRARDRDARKFRIVPELRRVVQFCYLNLMDAAYPFDRDVDVIFVRNVLIYFETRIQVEVLTRLIGHLRRGGYLILGHSESMIGANMRLRQVAAGIYQNA